MKRTLGVFALLFALSVFAAGTTANVSWTVPTQYADGTPLPATDVAFVTVTYVNAKGVTQSVHVAAPALTVNVPVPCGSASFSATVTTTAAAVYPNATSTATGIVPYASGVACSPNPLVLKVS